MTGIEVREASADDVEELTVISRAVELADPTSRPEIPPITAAEVRAHQFGGAPDMPARSWMAHDATGEPLGWVVAQFPMASNRTHLRLRIEVRPDRWREGVATALLRAALRSADPSRTLVASNVTASTVAFCERFGLASRQVVRESRLDLAECDLEQVRSWVAPADAVERGYTIVSWQGPTPDDLLPAVCTAITSMADAPVDDADWEEPVVTPELWHTNEVAASARLDLFSSLVLAPDGSAAGFTELGVTRQRPVLGDQGDTVVVAEHRGLRLGRWLKATNLLAAMDARPELRFVNTYNAESNPWMFSINEAMAFRPFREIRTVQGPTTAVVDALGRRATR